MDRRWIAALAVVLAAAAAGMWFGRGVTTAPSGSGLAPVPVQASTPGSFESATIVVHVAGWVASPGLVELASGARVGDAVAAAGGVKTGAVLAAVNLAQPLTDGQQVVVPGPEAEVAVTGGGEATGDGLIHLNRATVTELEDLPGVGPVLAERIVAHRDEMGPFATVEDLLEVSGIGEAKLASIRDLVAVP